MFGLGLFFYGAIDFFLSGMESLFGGSLLIAGLFLGLGCIALAIFLEKRRMVAFRDKVLSTHEHILIRFLERKRRKEVVFIPEGVFVAEYFYPFDGENMRLGRNGLELKNGTLEMHLEGFSGMKTYGRIVKVNPTTKLEALPAILHQLNQK